MSDQDEYRFDDALVGDNDPLTFDFTLWAAGESLASLGTITVAPNDRTLVSASLVGQQVTARFAGGTAGQDYTYSVPVTTATRSVTKRARQFISA